MTFKHSRRDALATIAALAATLPFETFAQEGGPIEWVVPFQAGGSADAVTRMFAEQMSKTLGRPLVVVNKPGAATQIAAEYVANAKVPTLFAGFDVSLAMNQSLYPRLRYDADKDFVPIGLMARAPIILIVSNEVPVTKLPELIAWLKNSKDPVNYGSSGTATVMHLAGELFKGQAGVKINHVAYRGSAPALQDVMGNQIPMAFIDLPTANQHIQSGKIKAVALATQARAQVVPNVPTFIEQGFKNFEAYSWQAAMASTNTPAELRTRLIAALEAAADSAAIKDRFQGLGIVGSKFTPEQLTRYILAERQRWGEVIRANNIKVEA